jgi:hypothetical protein
MTRSLIVALLVTLVPAVSAAQVNTTGSLSATRTVTQVQTPTTTNGTTGTTTGGTTTGGTTGGTTTGTTTNNTTTTNGTTAAATAGNVAIVLCVQDFTTGALVVSTASVSTGGAAIASGAACAQALSDLFVAGYGVIDVQPFNQQLQYTLVR